MYEFEKKLLGEDSYGSAAGMYTESDDDLDDLGIPDFDEEGDDGVSQLVNSILNGSDETSDDEDEDVDPDLKDLEDEFHISASEGAAAAAVEEGCGEGPCKEEGCDSGSCNEETEEEFPVEPLSPEDDARGDRLLKAQMTPELLASVLDDDEYEEFIESGDSTIACAEGYVSDSYIMEALADDENADGLFTEGAFAPEGKKFKMTKSARLKQLFEVSLQIEARLHKDPKYKKMMIVYAARRNIRNEWRRKYGPAAMKRAKRYLKGLMSSKSSGMNKLAQKLTGKK